MSATLDKPYSETNSRHYVVDVEDKWLQMQIDALKEELASLKEYLVSKQLLGLDAKLR